MTSSHATPAKEGIKHETSGGTSHLFGKQVKTLRRNGITPAHLFGHAIDSEALQLPTKEVQDALKATGQNDLVTLEVKGEGKRSHSTTVMVRNVQRNALTKEILHVDLYQVKLSKPIDVDVPLEFVGPSPAVDLKLGTLLHPTTELRVRGLPRKLPSSIQIDVSSLEEPHQAIRAEEIEMPDGITLVSSSEQIVANIVPLHRQEVEEVVAEEAVTEGEAEEESAGEAGSKEEADQAK